MLSFESDYICGAHENIIRRLSETNMEVCSGYGKDPYCVSAAEKIRKACDCPTAQVQFAVGGTQTNALVISTMLKNYEGVVAAKTGHVSLHEAGAIEATGHKVIELEQKNGKISADILKNYLETFYADGNQEQMVYPGMVYISHPTEYGTLYGKKEMEDISAICRQYKIPLYLDGARLGYGLMSNASELELKDIARLCDVFYIGGTKVGALCGEAIVFTRNNQPEHFFSLLKQRGGLLAKGRLLGIQFDELFTDDLYFKISRHAIELAEQMKNIFLQKGYELFIDSDTNQQFPVFENGKMKELSEKVAFSFWEKKDGNHTVTRFATSWASTEAEIHQLEKIL